MTNEELIAKLVSKAIRVEVDIPTGDNVPGIVRITKYENGEWYGKVFKADVWGTTNFSAVTPDELDAQLKRLIASF